MRYLRIETPADDAQPRGIGQRIVHGVLASLLPRADPDLEPLIEEVRWWWLEVEDSGEPCREIGFDAAGTPIVLGPIGRNVGFLVDGCDDWSDADADSAEAATHFEQTWRALAERFAGLDRE